MQKVQYKKSDFYYDLPEELIAQTPAMPRDSSRLLVYDSKTKQITDKIFKDVTEYLQAGDVLVINNTKVIQARLHFRKASSNGVLGALIEVFCLEPSAPHDYQLNFPIRQNHCTWPL